MRLAFSTTIAFISSLPSVLVHGGTANVHGLDSSNNQIRELGKDSAFEAAGGNGLQHLVDGVLQNDNSAAYGNDSENDAVGAGSFFDRLDENGFEVEEEGETKPSLDGSTASLRGTDTGANTCGPSAPPGYECVGYGRCRDGNRSLYDSVQLETMEGAFYLCAYVCPDRNNGLVGIESRQSYTNRFFCGCLYTDGVLSGDNDYTDSTKEGEGAVSDASGTNHNAKNVYCFKKN